MKKIDIKSCSRQTALEMLREIMEHHPVRFAIQGHDEEYTLSGTGIVDDAISVLISQEELEEDPIDEAIECVVDALEHVECCNTRMTALSILLTQTIIAHDISKEEFLDNLKRTYETLTRG